MSSLYQRFTGKINTTNSFPHPPEASHLLGGQVADEENAAKNLRQVVDGKPHVQFRKKCQQEDEDVRLFYFSSRSVQILHVYFDIASTERHSRRPIKYRSLGVFLKKSFKKLLHSILMLLNIAWIYAASWVQVCTHLDTSKWCVFLTKYDHTCIHSLSIDEDDEKNCHLVRLWCCLLFWICSALCKGWFVWDCGSLKAGFRLFILICPAVDQFLVHSVNIWCCGDKIQLVSPLIIYLQNLELNIWYNMNNATLFLPNI